ncbi:hypothetical protein MBLNU13_g00603t1 [Cladosporium sp. NU13]
MAPSTRKSKSQSRIVFTPIPSSDPAAQGYNKQIQDRAAAVGYGDASSQPANKRRKLQPTAPSQRSLASKSTMLPTPTENDLAAIADAPAGSSSSQRKSTRKAKQQRLDFGPSSGTVNLDPPTAPSMFTKQRGQKRAAEFSSDDSDELPSSAKLGKSKSKGGSKKQKTGDVGFMDLGGKKMKKKSRKQKEATPVESEEEEEGDEIVVVSASKTQPQATPQEESEEDEDEVVLPSARKARRPPKQVAEDDSEDELPILGTQKRRRVERQSSVLSSSPPAATAGSEDDLQIIENPKRNTRSSRKQNPTSEVEEDDESEKEDVAPRTPGRRLQRRGRQMTQQEKDDLDEDMDFIGPSSDVDDDRGPRDSQTLKKNARLQALERLKQVRSSQKSGLPDIQEDEEDDDATNQQELDDMYDNSEESPEPPPTSSRAMFAADEYDEDFIEEGEDDTLGVPDGIPLAFTRFASMKAKDLWKFAIEWFVQKKINPAFAMDDEIYSLTFQKLDDEVAGLVGSKFASSAWTGDFTIALRSRPEIAYNSIDRSTAEHAYRDKCDACNRSGHPATREVQFQGKPYNRQTLDEVTRNDSDSDDDEDDSGSDSAGETADDRPAYDASGREVPPANKTWYVGKFCMSNARTAHALHHWRFHLYEWVKIWIDGNGYSSAKELKKRDKMSTKKRRKYANKIVDRMVDEGVVKKLWKEFRGTIDDAANAKQGRYEAGSP